MLNLLRLLAAIAAVWVFWQLPAPRESGRPSADAPLASSDTLPPPRPIPVAEQFHGIALQLYTGQDCWNRFGKLIPEIADVGADTLLLVVHGYQDHAGSMNLRLHGEKTASAEDTGRIIDHAHRCGLRVMLMPIVLLEYPRGSEWRGRIKPPDIDGWWKRYTDFILHFARVAEKHDAEMFMVGSELVSLENLTERWRNLIHEVKMFYRGKLGYSANWDHFRPIEFWDLLDYAGMTSYYQLSDHEGPTVDEVAKAWEPYRDEILDFQQDVRKPIILTEVGWCSQDGASVEAWNYYRHSKATESGLREQAVLYEGFMKAWEGARGVGGIIWWEWTDEQGGKDNFGYTPRQKPAEAKLREWMKRKSARFAATQTGPARGGLDTSSSRGKTSFDSP